MSTNVNLNANSRLLRSMQKSLMSGPYLQLTNGNIRLHQKVITCEVDCLLSFRRLKWFSSSFMKTLFLDKEEVDFEDD